MGIQDSVETSINRYFFDADIMPGAESIVYTPFGGTPRTIFAQVVRGEIETVNGINAAAMSVTVENHATRGINLATMNASGDKVAIKYRPGGTTREYKLMPPADHDAYVLTFRILGKGE